MTLKRPFDATTLPALIMKIMKGNFDPAPSIYSHELRKLLLSMLHLDPNQRPTAAQIMCHPVMIRVIFGLYVNVGSIPCTSRSKNFSRKTSSTQIDTSKHLYSGSEFKISARKERKCQSIWLFENKSPNLAVLPIPSEQVIKSISLGSNHKIGVTENGVLMSWILRPIILMNSETECTDYNQTPFIATILDERNAVNIISVACGDEFTVCLSDNGVVFTFGKASSGCLGLSTEKDIHQPRIVEALFSNNIKSIACGPRHVLTLSEENGVFAWGYGIHGCLGLDSTEFQVLPQLIRIPSEVEPQKVFCGIDCSFIITEELSLFTCGSNRHNKLAMDSGEGNQIDETRIFTQVQSESLQATKIVSVCAGKSHTVLLTDMGEVYSMGSNRFGQLGWGAQGLDYSMPQKIERIKDIKVSQVACGDFFTVVITCDNALYCWGKCPRSLMGKEESILFDVGMPTFFKDKCVQCVSCYSESCLIVGEDQ